MLYIVFLVSLSLICNKQAGANCRPNATLFSNIANGSLFSNLTTNGTNPVLKHHHFHQLIIAQNQRYYHSSNSILIDSIYLEVSNISCYRLNDSHWVRRSPFIRLHQISVHTSKVHGQLKWSIDVKLHYTLRHLRRELMLIPALRSEARLSIDRFMSTPTSDGLLSLMLTPPSEAWFSVNRLKLTPPSTYRFSTSERWLSIDRPKWNTPCIVGFHITSPYLKQLFNGRPTPRIMRLNMSICVEELSINRFTDFHWVRIRLFDYMLNQSSCTTCRLLANYTMVDIPIKVTARTNTDPDNLISELTLKHFLFSCISKSTSFFHHTVLCKCHLVHMEYHHPTFIIRW